MLTPDMWIALYPHVPKAIFPPLNSKSCLYIPQLRIFYTRQSSLISLPVTEPGKPLGEDKT